MLSRQRPFAPPRTALAWALGFFLGAQLLVNVAVDRCRPDLRDPEYGLKLRLLRNLRRTGPNRPLVLVLGSSRVMFGLNAASLSAAASRPLVFNFGLTGAGPPAELLCLRRLLAEGIRPSRIFIEILSPLLAREGAGAASIEVERLCWSDLLLLRRYSPTPRMLVSQWWGLRLVVPWEAVRFWLFRSYAPSWLSHAGPKVNCFADLLTRQDAFGWLPYPLPTVPAEKYREGAAAAKADYEPLLADYRINARADQALHDLLEVCRQAGIPATLFLMPEGSEFQHLYPSAAQKTLAAYLRRLQREYQVPVIDARSWVPDADFWDSHHLLPAGAIAFTERFGREALGQPGGITSSACR